ncbi:hypothetical protein ACOSQ2_028556 [Xanthoceras sorbifolium]
MGRFTEGTATRTVLSAFGTLSREGDRICFMQPDHFGLSLLTVDQLETRLGRGFAVGSFFEAALADSPLSFSII